MPFNTVTDDPLREDTINLTDLKTEKDIVTLGLEALLLLKSQKKVKDYRGKLPWREKFGSEPGKTETLA
uniref:Uncharacterized protein n=1 Tax=Candidatus Kentrum sp. DK TaxID=2126562 RepID=A0A450S6I6_9GAMM|nr:MAG: hypothetical protein BECKDK2373C_GA0170839_101841 [Candidatus Kentron sp. DK]VFJ63475.1 MAG: hypothetical protein BECKDK2373B_GA0170837_112611 [Candidatus Kentron sp. DK]